MRSRYSAYAVGDTDYVWRTWHPRTRPEQVTPARHSRGPGWRSSRPTDDVVEFRRPHDHGTLHERSRFERRAGRWFYVDGTHGWRPVVVTGASAGKALSKPRQSACWRAPRC